jgi:hypothetical protein
VTAIAALAMFGGLTACTTAKHQSAPGPSLSSSTIPIPTEPAPSQPTSLPTYVQYSVPASVPNDAGKHKQVQVTSCSSSASGASASGTVHNTGTKSTSYAITVFFTSDTATAVNYATTSVTVAAGQQADFTAQRTFTAPDKVLCVLVGVT